MKGHKYTHQTKNNSAYQPIENAKRSDETQSLSPFLSRFINVHYLINTNSPDNHYLQAYFTDYSIIKHLQNEPAGGDLQSAQPNAANSKTIIDTFNRTGPTIVEDEDSQYLNYLKQYESVVKYSRRRECISPVNHKQEMNQLISQFLSDKRKKQDNTVKSVDKKGGRPKSITPIKIQKIDLNILKANHPKSHQLEVTAQKISENNKPNTYKKEQCISPRFVNITTPNQEQKGGQYKKQMKPTNSPRITVIKVEKPKNHLYKQQLKMQSALSNANHTVKGQYQQTYIKKKIAKLQKTEPLSKKIDNTGNTVPIAATYKEIKPSYQKIGRKPIKIQIQIPQQDSDEQSSAQKESPRNHMKSSLVLQDERQQIIKQISERVMTLLHKNKPPPNN